MQAMAHRATVQQRRPSATAELGDGNVDLGKGPHVAVVVTHVRTFARCDRSELLREGELLR